MKTKIILVLIMWITFCITANMSATSILIWDNDNNSDIEDPEGAGVVGCEYALEQALTANGESFTTLTYLPIDLSGYDVIFITLGHWCPS